jgi:hypothetical protein
VVDLLSLSLIASPTNWGHLASRADRGVGPQLQRVT